MKYFFTKENTKQTLTFASGAEVFTNCDRLHVTRIVCGEKFNPISIDKSESASLKPGTYEFKASNSSCKEDGCWMCVEQSLAPGLNFIEFDC